MDLNDLQRFVNQNADVPETDSEIDEDKVEEYLDGCWSPYHRTSKYWAQVYQNRRDVGKQIRETRREARRNIRRHAMSPPPTPLHIQGQQQTSMANDCIPDLHLDHPHLNKRKKPNRRAPRYPMTRSKGISNVALSHKRGTVRVGFGAFYVDVSYKTWLRDIVSKSYLGCSEACADGLICTQDQEGLRTEYPEESKLGDRWVTPTSTKHAEYLKRRRLQKEKLEEILKGKMDLPTGHKGFP